MALCVLILTAGLMSGCSAEGDAVDVPLEERSANDLPLDPPHWELRVSPDGEVGASPEREAEAGEAVGIAFDNDSDRAYKVRLLDPEGDKVFGMTVAPSDERDGRALPRTPGPHSLEVFPVDDPDAAQTFSVEVTPT